MTKEELNKLIEEFKKGKKYSTTDREVSYSGDIMETVIRYDKISNSLVYEIYNLHGNGEDLLKSNPIEIQEIPKLLGDDFEKILKKLN